jgi:amino acid permease
MQIYGVGSLLLCVLSMALLFFRVEWFGEIVFALSLAAMLISLGFSLAELFISVDALSLQISDLQEGCVDEEEE